jgi:hypothetical protein
MPVTNQQESNQCLNCETILDSGHRFCSHCGQERIAANESFGSMFRNFLGDYFTFDSKISGSLKPLLIKPGFLTTEYNIGRRVRYIAPLRLYIFISLIFFLILSMGQSDGLSVNAQTTDALVWNEFFRNYLPKVFFVMLPLFAALVGLLFRKSGMGYMSHLIFALHFHSFIFIILIVYLGLSRITASQGWFVFNSVLLSIIIIWFLIYLYIALLRVFRLKLWALAIRFFALLLFYSILTSAILLGIVGYITFTT